MPTIGTTTYSEDMFLNITDRCIHGLSFEENYFTVHLIHNSNHENATDLQHGSEVEFGCTGDDAIFIPNRPRIKPQTITRNGFMS